MRFQRTLPLLATVAPFASAAPVISGPAAGTILPAGTATTVTWKDNGAAPLPAIFQTCQVQLMAGSNAVNTPVWSSPTLVAYTALTASVTPPAAVSGPGTNAYFWGLLCTATGGTYQAFSPHFTLTGMTGAFPAIVAAAAAAPGVLTAAASVNKIAAVNAPAAGAADAALFTVPYNLQSGTVRYAPMQPVPGTAITATNTAPLYPTSAVVFQATYMPIPTIVTTYTQPGTFSAASHPNSAAAASSPVNDMQKFLNRWKD
ncbi:hypothetical protein BJ875DRAFT_135372 [Amylocarpus encephaloides]|uniref:Uncharacterized protein n=1 Tax=Amylocarpus encephaloides TaxID=45428 RepID=A0A9P7YD72_9HELO|nr:hypothetical protein BJ875DRAFT_135372 [Amylocarpus encephaloides]